MPNTDNDAQCVQHAIEHYQSWARQEPLPRLKVVLRGKAHLQQVKVEACAGQLHITANHPPLLASAIYRSLVALRAQRLPSMTGEQDPLYSLRPLILNAEQVLGGVISPQQLCMRVLQMGFNALILRGLRIEESEEALHCLSEVSTVFQQADTPLFVELKDETLSCQLADVQSSISSIYDRIPKLYGLWWSSNIERSTFRGDFGGSLTECVFKELESLKAALPSSWHLLYHLPSIPRYFNLQQLLDAPIPKMTLALPSCHLLWETLNRREEPCYTPLLPVMDLSYCEQCPAFADVELEALFSSMYRHQFVGIACLASYLPQEKDLFSVNLWVVGHAQWRRQSPQLLLETSLKSLIPDADLVSGLPCCRMVTDLATKLLLWKTPDVQRQGIPAADLEFARAQLRYLSSYQPRKATSDLITEGIEAFVSDLNPQLEVLARFTMSC